MATGSPTGILPLRATVVAVVGLTVMAALLALTGVPLASGTGPGATGSSVGVGAHAANGTIPIALLPVRFTETGLPVGLAWSVALDGQVQRSSSSLVTFLQPASGIPYQYWVPPASTGSYVPNPPSGSVMVSGTAVDQVIAFSIPSSNESAAVFSTASLPRNISWTVGIDHANWTASNQSLQVLLPNGTYNYTIPPVVGFLPSPANGTLVIAGRGIVSTIAFSPVPAPRVVVFRQSGLPYSENWSVVVNSTAFWGSGPAIQLNASAGVYPYSLPAVGSSIPSPNNGSFEVNATIGSVRNVSVPFITASVATYPVGFFEVGLPDGTSWTVTLNGQSHSGIGAIPFNESNGTYPYNVPAVGKFEPNATSGSVTVAGGPLNVSINFTNATPPPTGGSYTVKFHELGLAIGTNWSVTLAGRTNSSTKDFVAFTEPNGTYPFAASAAGYSSSPHTGTVTVNGSASVTSPVTISFTANGTGMTATYLVKFVASGLTAGTNWSVVLAGVHESSTQTTINFNEPNGTYAYTIGPVAGYTSNFTSGNALVRGTNVTLFVSYTASSSSHSTNLISGIPAWGWAVIGLLVVILIVGVLLVMTRHPPPG